MNRSGKLAVEVLVSIGIAVLLAGATSLALGFVGAGPGWAYSPWPSYIPVIAAIVFGLVLGYRLNTLNNQSKKGFKNVSTQRTLKLAFDVTLAAALSIAIAYAVDYVVVMGANLLHVMGDGVRAIEIPVLVTTFAVALTLQLLAIFRHKQK